MYPLKIPPNQLNDERSVGLNKLFCHIRAFRYLALLPHWYATQRIMVLIDNWQKIYYCPLKKNRLVDDTEGLRKI